MWLNQLKDQAWEFVRWQVQHTAYHSNCSDEVLAGAAKAVRDGAQALGYRVSAPLPNRDVAYYKTYIQDVTHNALDAIYHYRFVECSLSKAMVPFRDAADRIKNCRKALADIEGDEIYFVPAED